MPEEAGKVKLRPGGDGTLRQAKTLWFYAEGTGELGKRPQQHKGHRKPDRRKQS